MGLFGSRKNKQPTPTVGYTDIGMPTSETAPLEPMDPRIQQTYYAGDNMSRANDIRNMMDHFTDPRIQKFLNRRLSEALDGNVPEREYAAGYTPEYQAEIKRKQDLANYLQWKKQQDEIAKQEELKRQSERNTKLTPKDKAKWYSSVDDEMSAYEKQMEAENAFFKSLKPSTVPDKKESPKKNVKETPKKTTDGDIAQGYYPNLIDGERYPIEEAPDITFGGTAYAAGREEEPQRTGFDVIYDSGLDTARQLGLIDDANYQGDIVNTVDEESARRARELGRLRQQEIQRRMKEQDELARRMINSHGALF